MTTETALPTGEQAEAGEQAKTAAAEQVVEQTGEQVEAKEGEQAEEKAKPEKTPEQREVERLRRRVDSLTRQKYELQARAGQQPRQQQEETQTSDDEPVTLTRAQLQARIEEEASKRAPSIAEQRAETERRQGVVKSLAKEWGQDEFDAKASDLDAVFEGLADAQGRPKPATDAIFDADNPKAVIEYLTDPDNADEAERLARLPAVRAGREIARIEQKLKDEAAKDKPKASKAPTPIEAVKGGGVTTKDPSQMTDAEFAAWRKGQIAKRK